MNMDHQIENHMLSEYAFRQYYGDSAVTRNAAQAAYAATEKRLYALPILRERIEDNREELTELENMGVEALRHHSSSLVRLIRPACASPRRKYIPPRWRNFVPGLRRTSGRCASCRTPSTPLRRIPITLPSS